MKHSNIFPALIFIIYLCLAGCSSAESPEPTAEVPANTAAAQIVVRPTRTPTITSTLWLSPTPTLLPSPTPTLYPDAWVSGLLWYETESSSIIYVGRSSVAIHNAQITYEPLNEVVAEEIAQFSFSTLVVFYGDYTPLGEREGHIVVEQVEQINLPYHEDILFSEFHTDPNDSFSFAYPERWTLTILAGGNYLSVSNHPSDGSQFSGPGMDYTDPTGIRIDMWKEDKSLGTYVQSHREKDCTGDDVTQEQYLKVTIT
jgi:hypothetical protein